MMTSQDCLEWEVGLIVLFLSDSPSVTASQCFSAVHLQKYVCISQRNTLGLRNQRLSPPCG